MLYKVIAGEYAGKEIMMHSGVPYISTHFFKKGVKLCNETVASYEVLDNDAIKENPWRKQKGLLKILVSVTFYDGKKSLLEISEKQYKALIKSCFK